MQKQAYNSRRFRIQSSNSLHANCFQKNSFLIPDHDLLYVQSLVLLDQQICANKTWSNCRINEGLCFPIRKESERLYYSTLQSRSCIFLRFYLLYFQSVNRQLLRIHRLLFYCVLWSTGIVERYRKSSPHSML